MYHKNLFIEKIILGIGIFLIPYISFAQEPEKDEIDKMLDALFYNEQQLIDDILESDKQSSLLYTNVTYNNDTYFMGRDSGLKQYNVTPQLTYFSPTGISLSIAGLYYQNFSPNWDFTNLTLEYFHEMGKNKNTNFTAGYSHYFFSDGSTIFTNSVDLGLGFKTNNRKLGTNFSASYLFGEDTALQLTSSTYGKIDLLNKPHYSIKLVPQINFFVSKQTMTFLTYNNPDDLTDITYSEYDIFNLLNTQINIPLKLVTKKWDFNLSYNVNIPQAVAEETDLKTTGFLSLSAGYLIGL